MQEMNTGASPSNVQKFLRGVQYPVDKSKLIERARSNGASQDVISKLENMTESKFTGPQDVMKGF